MEVVLLRLRIAANIGIALVVLAVLCDMGWNGRKILSDAHRRKFVPTGGGLGGLLALTTEDEEKDGEKGLVALLVNGLSGALAARGRARCHGCDAGSA